MGKRIFWIFILTIFALSASLILYIQSDSFAVIVKRKLRTSFSRDIGLNLDFDRIKIGVLPPSLALVNVELSAAKADNALGVGKEMSIRAQNIGFNFKMFQSFSRGIFINKVFLSGGNLKLPLPKKKSSEKKPEKLSELVHQPIHFSISNNFSVTIRQLELKETKLELSWQEADGSGNLEIEKIEYFAITPSREGTNLVVNISQANFRNKKINESLKTLRLNADLEKNAVFLSAIDLQRRDAALHASGKFLGSIDRVEDAKIDVDLILRSPFSELRDFDSGLSPFQGEITADVKVVGRTRSPELQGKLSIDNFQYSLWNLDKIELAGSYVSDSLIIDSFRAEKKGGTLQSNNQIEIPLPLRPLSIATKLKFRELDFSEFAGELLRDVNNLRVKISGESSMKVDLIRGVKKLKIGSLSLKPNLSLQNLELNNQAFGKKRDYKTIFILKPLTVKGDLTWANDELKINEAQLAFSSGSVDVKGKVSEKGYDIHGASENIDLGSEVGNIGGLRLQGIGPAKIHVRGPGKAIFIDFDLNQEGVKFANFDFGAIDGRVTYDDQGSYIYITGLKGKKNASSYSLDGRVNVGDGDDIQLSAAFPSAEPDDLFEIFAKQIEKISWIPHGMVGKIQGNVSVGGGYSGELNTLEINSKIKGTNLSYLGEIVQDLQVEAGVHKGVIFAKNLKARKYDTYFTGEIEYFPNEEMIYKLSAEKGKLRSLDFLITAGLPIDGLVRFHSEGKGKWETLHSKTRIQVRNAFIRTMPLTPADFNFDTDADEQRLDFSMGDSISAKISIARNSKSNSSAELIADEADFSFLLCLVNRKICTDPGLRLRLDAGAKMMWKGSAWEAMSAEGVLKSIQIAKSGINLSNKAPGILRGENGLLSLSKLDFEGENSKISAQLKGRANGGSIENLLQGNLSLKVLEFITPLIEEARGNLGVDLNISGALQSAKFSGNLGFQEGFIRLSGLDAPLESVKGKIKFNGNRATIDGFSGQIGGGVANLAGNIGLYLDRPPIFALDVNVANSRLKFFPVNFAEFSEANLSFTGDKTPYLFSGTAKAKRVMMRSNFDLGDGQKALQNARYLPEKLKGAKSLYEVRIRATAESGIFVQNDILDAEFRGEVTLLNNFEFPQMIARAELVKGKLLFRNTAFNLDHAYIRAPNPEIFNPQFSIGGLANVDSYRINIFASGTIDKPKISLSSAPALPQEDIISLLAFGYRGEDAKRVNPNDTSALTYSEVGSILLEQLKLSQNLQSKGVRVRVAPSISDNEANIIRPNSAPGAVSPKVYLQTQVVKNLEATFGSTVGSTQGQEIDANLEYRMGKKASLSAVYEQEPGLDATETKNSYGADIKFRWGFK